MEFVARINEHDPDRLAELMAEDHLFIDGLGRQVRGKYGMRDAWKAYLAWFPDYRISVDLKLADGDFVGLFGTAEGTYAPDGVLRAEQHWKIPAAWRAVVRQGRILEWQVYADNEPVWKIMGVQRS
jgi:ketosteroid isomerase-like protein